MIEKRYLSLFSDIIFHKGVFVDLWNKMLVCRGTLIMRCIIEQSFLIKLTLRYIKVFSPL